MIISASYKTDIPAFYGDWFLGRLAAGGCWVTNPWNGRRFWVSLAAEDVSGFVFWTKNLRPFFGALEAVTAPFVVQYTVTGYPTALEPAVVAPGRAVADIADVAARFGPGRAVWRYDPILVSDLTPPDWHRETFAGLAENLAGLVDEVVVSFAHGYAKTKRNLAAVLGAHGWRDPALAEKKALIDELTAIAATHGMALTVCAQPEVGGVAARCIDATRLDVTAPVKGNRDGCLCSQSRDIGAYDTCPHGCVYCYAVSRQSTAKRRYRAHDRNAAVLG